MTLPEAYTQVERALVELKLENVFREWLERELTHSKIEIAQPLAEIIVINPDELRQRALESRGKEDALIPVLVEPPASMDGPTDAQEAVPME